LQGSLKPFSKIDQVPANHGPHAGIPADLTLIRMQADATLPVEQRRHYTGVFNALGRIIKEEGAAGLFKGCAPVVVRAMALNAGTHHSTRTSEQRGMGGARSEGMGICGLTPRINCVLLNSVSTSSRHACVARPGPG